MLLTPTILGDLWIAALVGLIAWHSWHLYQKGRWLLLDPINMFWTGILICYVEQPILRGDVYVAWHDEGVFNRTLFAVLFGVAFVVLGYESDAGVRLARKLPEFPARLSSTKLLIAALGLIAAGFGGYAYLIHISGGLGPWLSVGRGGTDYERVQGYWAELINGLPAGVTLLLFRGEVHRPSFLGRLVAWLAAGLMWLWFLYLGSRSRLIMFSIVVLACYYLPRRRSPPLPLVVILFFVLQVSVNFQKNYRDQFTRLSFNLADVEKEELWDNILPDFLGGKSGREGADIPAGSEFNCALAVVQLVPETVPYNYGYGFLEVLTRPVPRAVWPDKRYPHLESVQGVLRAAELTTTTVVTAQRSELLMGPAFAFTGHWYYVGGFVGLLIGGVFTGVLFRFIRGFLDWSPQNHSVLITYPFFLSIGFSEAATTPGIWIFSLPFVLLPFVFVVYFCREQPPLTARTPIVHRQKNVPSLPRMP